MRAMIAGTRRAGREKTCLEDTSAGVDVNEASPIESMGMVYLPT